jgi:hypothetical protein
MVQWSKYCGIGCFVPDVNAPGIPTLGAIDLRKGFAKNKPTIIGGRIEEAHRLGIADSPVMGVVEQQQKVGAAAAQSANGDNQLRVRPFMDDHNVHFRQSRRDVEPRSIHRHAQIREMTIEILDGTCSVIAE